MYIVRVVVYMHTFLFDLSTTAYIDKTFNTLAI